MAFKEYEKKEVHKGGQLCTWMTAGRRCQHMGAINKLCGWHYTAKNNPETLQDYDLFVEYMKAERETYPREWGTAHHYVDDKLSWACVLGKEQRSEFLKAVRAIEEEIDSSLFDKSETRKTPEESIKAVEDNFEVPF